MADSFKTISVLSELRLIREQQQLVVEAAVNGDARCDNPGVTCRQHHLSISTRDRVPGLLPFSLTVTQR